MTPGGDVPADGVGGGPPGLAEWVAAACAEVGIDPGDVPVPVVLDLARDVAHGVLRPGAPVTAYLLGLAVGHGADPTTAATRLTDLALTWRSNPPTPASVPDPPTA